MIKIVQKEGFLYMSSVEKAMTTILANKYQNATPFPHIVIDDFLPTFFVDYILKNFPAIERASVSHKSTTQYLKRGYRPQELGINPIVHYLSLLNSYPIVEFLETLTGIKGLITDHHYEGGGLHETHKGGYLDVHVDFSHHTGLNLARRINMIIFLNNNWKPKYGGQLELWDTELTKKVVSIDPIYNRCVIFNTSDKSFHGQPNQVKSPEDLTRKSVALYYYTAIHQDMNLSSTTYWKSKLQKKNSLLSTSYHKFKSFLRM